MFSEKNGVLGIHTDPFLNKCIEKYLVKTQNGEFINATFSDIIKEIFLNHNRNDLVEAFKSFDLSLMEDTLWLKASNMLINEREYLTYSNVGAKYYNMLLIDFVNENRMVLINEFIMKFCKERRIRKEIMNQALATKDIKNTIIGSILIKALKDEKEKLLEEEPVLETMFSIRSKERYYKSLPNLNKGETYHISIKEGNGIAYINEENVLVYTPPVVGTTTFIKAKILVVDENGFTLKNYPFNIEVLPQRYLRPEFNIYKVMPGKSINVTLEPVEESYTYSAYVDNGFGSIVIDDKFNLIYTAPDSNISQNVAVKLILKWKDSIVLYESIINFNIVLNDNEATINTNVSSIEKLQKELENVSNNIKEVDSKIDRVQNYVEDINKIKNQNEFEVLE